MKYILLMKVLKLKLVRHTSSNSEVYDQNLQECSLANLLILFYTYKNTIQTYALMKNAS